MDNYLGFRNALNNGLRTFSVDTRFDDYRIKQNGELANSLSMHYRFLTFSYTFVPKFIPGNVDDERKGNSSSSLFHMDLIFSRLVQELSYDRTRGFYLVNTDEYVPDWDPDQDAFIRFPDLVVQEVKGFTGYKFDRRLSLQALASQTQVQLRSAGSFFPGLNYRYYKIEDRTPLTGNNSTQTSDNIEVLLVPGYVHTFVFAKRCYASIAAFFGGGVIHTDLLTRQPTGDLRTRSSNVMGRGEVRSALGYNREHFFAGGRIRWSDQWFDQDGQNAVIQHEQLVFEVFLGFRIKAPGFMRSSVDMIERKRDEFLDKVTEPPGR
ncbi:MAG: DUF4421 family protein [Flavobacteriales bacterium]|nr:DUF4421 family protein [Flavobacteriales bacterium]